MPQVVNSCASERGLAARAWRSRRTIWLFFRRVVFYPVRVCRWHKVVQSKYNNAHCAFQKCPLRHDERVRITVSGCLGNNNKIFRKNRDPSNGNETIAVAWVRQFKRFMRWNTPTVRASGCALFVACRCSTVCAHNCTWPIWNSAFVVRPVQCNGHGVQCRVSLVNTIHLISIYAVW